MAYKSPKQRVTGFFNPLKAKVVDAASDVMSAPARSKARNAKKRADAEVAMIKMVRAKKGEPDKGNESDPLFRARANVQAMRGKRRTK